MELLQLLKPWIKEELLDCEINGITNDSRLVKTGDLFLAYPGTASDGRLFITQSIAAGAAAIAYDPDHFPIDCSLPDAIPCIAVPALAVKIGSIANRFYDNPGNGLNITGVTGTNGKTTIAYQLAQAHHLLGQGAAYIGTIGQGEVNHLKPLANTTPDALCLQHLLSQYKNQNIQQVCMEVSSHALMQHRVESIHFNQAIFTNLTLDHLDYHHTMQAYAQAKSHLFAMEKLEWVILNRDDPYFEIMSQAVNPIVKKITYGLHKDCDVKATYWHSEINGTCVTVKSPWGQLQLTVKAPGEFNIYNSLAMLASLMACGYSSDVIIPVLEKVDAAPGRMEVVANSPKVLIDYAHTPDALENALSTLKKLKTGRLWVVFGCGGNRDKSKRPIMGKIASLYADKIVMTSDNPRNEDPQSILDDILAGIIDPNETMMIPDRTQAILYALNHANQDDIILIAGKGHESYQQIGSVKYPFSDQNVVKKYLFQR